MSNPCSSPWRLETGLAVRLTVVLLFFGSGALAWAAGLRTARGPLVEVDPSRQTLVLQDGDEKLTVQWRTSTKFTVDRQAAKPAELRPGMEVSVFYDTDTRIVTSVRAATEGADAASASPSTPSRTSPSASGGSTATRGSASGGGSTPGSSSASSASRSSGGTSGSAAAGDWPQWRGARQDGISTDVELLDAWPSNGPTLMWEAPQGEGYSAVAVVGDRIYGMDMSQGQEFVYCLDAGSGRTIWREGYDGAYQNGFGNGPRATPTVDGDRVYSQGATGWLQCRQAADGKLVWAKNILTELRTGNISWGISGSPLVIGDRVWVNPGAAFNKRTGELQGIAVRDAPGYATPLAFQSGGSTWLAMFTGKGLSVVNADSGQEQFRFAWPTDHDANIATPIYDNDRLFISSGYNAGCALLEIKARRNAIEGRELYRNKSMRNHFSTCILHDGHLYGFDDNFFTCLELRTGERKWRERGFEKGALTMADGKLIVLGERGRAALVRPNPRALEIISSFEPLDGKCWTAPVVAGGRLYLKNESVLRCYDLRKSSG